MKIYVGDDVYSKAQQRIDLLPEGSLIALAYNEDTSKLDFSGKKVVELCDLEGCFSNVFKFDKQLSDYNGEEIDLCVLGLGFKGQIGFNEVATPFNSLIHTQKLTASTKEEFSFLGDIPDYGTTMGIKNICSSKEILVIATGEKRAGAAFGMIYGRDDSTVPAAFLQIPSNVNVFLDFSAASKL